MTSNAVQSNESTQQLRSVSECVADLIRTGKDAQMMLEPLRSFCHLVGYDQDAVRRGECDEQDTYEALYKHLDELHQLFESWDDPSFPSLVPQALDILKKLFKRVDDGIFREDVGTWNAAWYGLYNAVASKRAPAAPASPPPLP